MALAPKVGIECDLAFEHCTGNDKQAVGNRAQGSGITVAAKSRFGLLGSLLAVSCWRATMAQW